MSQVSTPASRIDQSSTAEGRQRKENVTIVIPKEKFVPLDHCILEKKQREKESLEDVKQAFGIIIQ